MTPSARIAAAIGLIDAFLGGEEMMDRLLIRWGKENRYAGSGDRRAVADLAYSALRRLRSASWPAEPAGRVALMGLMRRDGADVAALFSGAGYGASALTDDEAAALVSPLPDAPDPVTLDYPDWLDAGLRASLGEKLTPVMRAMQERAPLHLRVNTLRGDAAAAVARLAEDGIVAEPARSDIAPDALLVLDGERKVARSGAYLEGLVEIQDLASQAVARLGQAAPGETVLDFCAGGGGKTLALAAMMAGEGHLFAHDADPARMKDLPSRAARAGVAVEILEPGAPAENCDLVFVDAPCSGSGAWARNPDAKWRLTPQRLEDLLALQDAVLDQAAASVRAGGRLVYATCSLLASENGERVDAFLARHSGFATEDRLSLTPLDGGDGFFGLRMRRL